ncbi:peptidoglycan DD-metalloendopeptidase family protein [Microbacterium sp. HD4P20]|uniref:peptidoglycan DD-metalloendopeptidase family protein n=1 Tax=Microbacterium sp. HD4P20 TaxID=2864874 RepID=UPI0020A43CF8|nr:peptidoglycan DD-metalloendopeptidase family protein [Microbacterium sp. HD4P20]MCP2636294.1 peptidoglycan DD-metalloendopeptidase family protein [Microbacterium sp. HD4P20]
MWGRTVTQAVAAAAASVTTSATETAIAETAAAQTATTETSAPYAPVAEPTVAEPTVAEPTAAEPTVAEPTLADAPQAGVPAAGDASLATPTLEVAAAIAAAMHSPVSASDAPLSRRARRATLSASQPIPVPVIANEVPAEPDRPMASFRQELRTPEAPAPLMESVLAPAEPFELLEPAADAQPAADAPPAADAAPADSAPAAEATEAPETASESTARPTASGVDEFEAAARLFSFTGETPVQGPAAAPEATEQPADPQRERAHTVPRRAKTPRAPLTRVATTSFSIGAFGIVGLLTVGLTTPSQAVAAASGADASLSVVAPADGSVTEVDEDEIQAYVAPATVQPDALDRTEQYGTTTTAELASEAGIRNFSNLFHNDPNSNIQWPFAVGVTMSYGFGMRSGRMHEGIDFTPGAGSPIQAIADGTVRVASEAGGAYGVHVIIDHMVDGQLVSSHYAHMQYGSMQVTAGQHVTVGTVLGRTGNTGRSYGAHTHFEILMNGTTPIDPMPWLREHTDGTHVVG